MCETDFSFTDFSDPPDNCRSPAEPTWHTICPAAVSDLSGTGDGIRTWDVPHIW